MMLSLVMCISALPEMVEGSWNVNGIRVLMECLIKSAVAVLGIDVWWSEVGSCYLRRMCEVNGDDFVGLY